MYILVLSDYDNSFMLPYDDEEKALRALVNLPKDQELIRAFRITQSGKVTHCNVVFRGRLLFEDAPVEAYPL